MRKCKKCGKVKPLHRFPVVDKEGRRRHECHECYLGRHRRYYQNHKERYLQRAEEAYYKTRYWWLRTPEGKAWRVQQGKSYSRKLRNKILDHYGRKCSCCGETEDRFLCVDHVNGCGKDLRKIHGLGRSLYQYLIRENYPKYIQILCFNCNMGRALNDGTCPHKKGSTTSRKA